jgi:CheY-like chemotaxis protein
MTGNMKVLVVDDERMILEVLEIVLRGAGCTVHLCQDPIAALRWLETEAAPDVLLTDVDMPRVTGCQLAERIQALRPHIRLVLMTGAWSRRVDDFHRRWPAVPVLTKPFPSELLLDTLAQALASPPPRPVREAPARPHAD